MGRVGEENLRSVPGRALGLDEVLSLAAHTDVGSGEDVAGPAPGDAAHGANAVEVGPGLPRLPSIRHPPPVGRVKVGPGVTGRQTSGSKGAAVPDGSPGPLCLGTGRGPGG